MAGILCGCAPLRTVGYACDSGQRDHEAPDQHGPAESPALVLPTGGSLEPKSRLRFRHCTTRGAITSSSRPCSVSRPMAARGHELWLGTHPTGPATLADGRPLADVTGPLSYLLKVLARSRTAVAAGAPVAPAGTDRVRVLVNYLGAQILRSGTVRAQIDRWDDARPDNWQQPGGMGCRGNDTWSCTRERPVGPAICLVGSPWCSRSRVSSSTTCGAITSSSRRLLGVEPGRPAVGRAVARDPPQRPGHAGRRSPPRRRHRAAPLPAQGARRSRAAVAAGAPVARAGAGRVRRRSLPRSRAEAGAAVRADARSRRSAASGPSTPRSELLAELGADELATTLHDHGPGEALTALYRGQVARRPDRRGGRDERPARGAWVRPLADRYPGDPSVAVDAAAEPRAACARRGDPARRRATSTPTSAVPASS